MVKSYLSRNEVNFLKTKEFGVLIVLLILIGTNITYLKYSDEKVTNMLNAVLDRILNNEVTNE